MSPENSIQNIHVKLMEFVNIEPKNGINRFTFEGTSDRAKTDAIIGLFQRQTPLGTMVFLTQYHFAPYENNELTYLSRILHTTVPTKHTNYEENEAMKLIISEKCTRNGLPIAALLYGREINPVNHQLTDNPFIQLCVIRGMTPQHAIHQMQEVATNYLAANN